MTGVPVEQIRSLIRMLWPAEITPTAKRQLEALCDQAETAQTKGGKGAVAPETTNRPDLVIHHEENA